MRPPDDFPLAHRPPPQQGFTLLELLLVVFILSALALTAMAFVDNQDDQFRFEDTRRRLEMIRRAIVGEAAPVHGGQVLVSGFVADNGVLPGDLASLIGIKPTGFAASVSTVPMFDPDPDAATGLNNATGSADIELSENNEKLEKGWRGGYLHAPAGTNGEFRDGWGNAGGAANYGWGFATGVADARQVTSLGKDAVDNDPELPATDYAADVSETVSPSDWSVDIAGLTVRVKPVADFSGAKLRASLLVFVNDNAGGKWRRYSTDSVACLDGTGDGLAGGVPCPAEATLSFPAHPWSTRVPIGRHLLVLVQDNNTTAHDGGTDEKPYLSGGATRITRPITCYAAGCTVETLILK